MKLTKKFTSKVLSVILMASMFMSFTGCDAIKNLTFNEDEVLDVVAEYLDLVKANKYSKAAKLVKGGDDAFKDLELSDYESDILDLVTATTEYEISEVEGEKNSSATCELTIESVSLKDALKKAEDSEVSSIKKAIKKASTNDDSITIKLVYSDDSWVIKDVASIVDFYTTDFKKLEVPEDIPVDIPTGSAAKEFNVTDACAYFDSRCQDFNNFSLEEAFDSIVSEDNPSMTYEEFLDSMDSMYYEVLIALMNRTIIDYEIYEATGDSVVLQLTVQIPDTSDMVQSFLTNARLVEILSKTIFDDSYNMEDDSEEAIVSAMIDFIERNNKYRYYYTTTLITLDELGDYVAEGGLGELVSELVPDLDFGNTFLIDPDFLTLIANYSLLNGYIDGNYYQYFLVEIENIRNSISVEPGSDFQSVKIFEDADFTYEAKYYEEGDPGIYIEFETLDRHSATETFTLVCYYEGEVVSSFSGYCGKNRNNLAQISLKGPLKAGTYDIEITGFNGELFAILHLNVIEV